MYEESSISESENAEKENSRQKALTEKRRKVQFFGETIDSIVDRYNSVVEMINAPSDYKFLDGTDIFKRIFFSFLLFIFFFVNFHPYRFFFPYAYLRLFILRVEFKTTAPLELKKNTVKKKKDTRVSIHTATNCSRGDSKNF